MIHEMLIIIITENRCGSDVQSELSASTLAVKTNSPRPNKQK